MVARRIEENSDMLRKTFDVLISGGGLILAVVLVVAGALCFWGYSYTSTTVHNQLADQKIYFPPKSAFAHAKAGTEITPSMIPSVSQYAGQELTTGAQAEVYANDFIAVHLQQIGGGKTYAQMSTLARTLPPGSPAAAKAEALAQTLFQGTTLRGLLLEAYAFSVFGEIAFVAAIVSWSLAFVLVVLALLGLVHARRTTEAEELVGARIVREELGAL
jgi:hypothetical protein